MESQLLNIFSLDVGPKIEKQRISLALSYNVKLF